MNWRMSLMVCEGLNFATRRVPSARRICTVVVGWEGSRGTEGGGGAEEVDEGAVVDVASGEVCDTTAGAMLE